MVHEEAMSRLPVTLSKTTRSEGSKRYIRNVGAVGSNPITTTKWPRPRLGGHRYESLVVSYLEEVHAQALCERIPAGPKRSIERYMGFEEVVDANRISQHESPVHDVGHVCFEESYGPIKMPQVVVDLTLLAILSRDAGGSLLAAVESGEVLTTGSWY